jgi:hypothetical protein
MNQMMPPTARITASNAIPYSSSQKPPMTQGESLSVGVHDLEAAV